MDLDIDPRMQDCMVPDHVWLTLEVNALLAGRERWVGRITPDLIHYLIDLALMENMTLQNLRIVLSRTTWLHVDDDEVHESILEGLREIKREWCDRESARLRNARDWTLLRRRFARTFVQARCTGPFCGEGGCCAEIIDLLPSLGISEQRSGDRVELEEDETVRNHTFPGRSSRRDALGMLSGLRSHSWTTKNRVLEGFLEVPELVGNLLHDDGWRQRFDDIEGVFTVERDIVLEDFILELISFGFGNEFLNALTSLDLDTGHLEVSFDEEDDQ